MPDEEAAPTTEEAEVSAPQADAETPPQTVEEVEALWKNRVSQKDKAHAAAEKVLRDQLATFQAKASAPPDGDAGQTEALKEQLKGLQQQVEEERVKNLQMKYPVLAKQVGEDISLFKTTDEATLAKLNALGDLPPAAPPIMDHSTPKRTSAAGQTPREPTSDELKGQLLKEEAAWKEAQGY